MRNTLRAGTVNYVLAFFTIQFMFQICTKTVQIASVSFLHVCYTESLSHTIRWYFAKNSSLQHTLPNSQDWEREGTPLDMIYSRKDRFHRKMFNEVKS